MDSASYLGEIIDRVPGMLIPCVEGNFAELLGFTAVQPGGFGHPGGVELHARRPQPWHRHRLDDRAPRARRRDRRTSSAFPTPTVSQVALIPFGYTVGTDFKPAKREPLDRVLHWDSW